jgi:hypothetical protein
LGLDEGVVRQGGVYDASFGGRHRLQREGAPPLTDVVGGAESDLPDAVEPSLLVALDVHAEGDVALQGAADHGGHERLEVVKGRAAPADEQSGVLALDIEDDGRAGLAAREGVVLRDVGVHVRVHVHEVEELLEDISGLL